MLAGLRVGIFRIIEYITKNTEQKRAIISTLWNKWLFVISEKITLLKGSIVKFTYNGARTASCVIPFSVNHLITYHSGILQGFVK